MNGIGKTCRRRLLLAGLLITAALLVVAELSLRLGFGFCDAVLYRPSDKYEYIAQPSQDRHRFGAHIHYNSYSQRNYDEPDTVRRRIVLGLGDSVIFGGSMVDQDSLATSLFTQETGMLMLNISAGSWGPDNCAAYLREQGAFGARAMVLVCSSHDAFDCMSFTPVVGRYPNYPDHQYRLALWELMDRYLLPRLKSVFSERTNNLDPDQMVLKGADAHNMVAQKSPDFNRGFDQLLAMSRNRHIPFAMYLHAEQAELQAGQYNAMGQMIIDWARLNNVPLTLGMAEGERTDMYRDNIHLNDRGQRFLATALERMVARLR